MTDWNPTDPDATRVYYDLSAWSIDHQAELASEMADAELPHAWDGAELMVPEEFEQAADLLIADVEGRLGIVDEAAAPLDAGDGADPVELAADAATTEYDLGEWPEGDRQALTHALARAGIPFRWEDQLLLVGTDDEPVVDSLLDDIESGEFVDLADHGETAAGEQPPTEILTAFFLAGERLRRHPLDPDGLEQLLAATDVADAAVAPYGVQPVLWQQTCALADRLADALVGEEEVDHEEAMAAATELHDLLRPYV